MLRNIRSTTTEDQDFIEDHGDVLSDGAMSEHLGLCKTAVARIRIDSGITRYKRARHGRMREGSAVMSASEYVERMRQRLRDNDIGGSEAVYFLRSILWSRVLEIRHCEQQFNLAVRTRDRGGRGTHDSILSMQALQDDLMFEIIELDKKLTAAA